MCVQETCHISCELRSDQVVHFLTDTHTRALDTVSPHNKEMHFWLFKATYIVGFGFVLVYVYLLENGQLGLILIHKRCDRSLAHT